MKQLLQSARTGEISIAEVPSPRVQPGYVLVVNDDSLGSVSYICNRDSSRAKSFAATLVS